MRVVPRYIEGHSAGIPFFSYAISIALAYVAIGVCHATKRGPGVMGLSTNTPRRGLMPLRLSKESGGFGLEWIRGRGGMAALIDAGKKRRVHAAAARQSGPGHAQVPVC